MCGRFNVRRSPEEIARWFRVPGPAPNYPQRFNIAPTDDVLTVRYNREDSTRHLGPIRWGLIPSWAKDKSIGYKTINARAEGIATKPAFRQAFAKRRCIIPADGFYEWKQTGDITKQPYAIEPADGGMFAFAGLWEGWRDPEREGKLLRTCTIVTTAANEAVAPIHDRMPVILPETAWPQWLGEVDVTAEELLAMLLPAPDVALRIYPISTRVNSVAHDDAGILEPLPA